MSNIEILGDGVTIYPDTMPPLLRQVVIKVVEENPNHTVEESISLAFDEVEFLMDVGRIALKEAREAIEATEARRLELSLQ